MLRNDHATQLRQALTDLRGIHAAVSKQSQEMKLSASFSLKQIKADILASPEYQDTKDNFEESFFDDVIKEAFRDVKKNNESLSASLSNLKVQLAGQNEALFLFEAERDSLDKIESEQKQREEIIAQLNGNVICIKSKLILMLQAAARKYYDLHVKKSEEKRQYLASFGDIAQIKFSVEIQGKLIPESLELQTGLLEKSFSELSALALKVAKRDGNAVKLLQEAYREHEKFAIKDKSFSDYVKLEQAVVVPGRIKHTWDYVPVVTALATRLEADSKEVPAHLHNYIELCKEKWQQRIAQLKSGSRSSDEALRKLAQDAKEYEAALARKMKVIAQWQVNSKQLFAQFSERLRKGQDELKEITHSLGSFQTIEQEVNLLSAIEEKADSADIQKVLKTINEKIIHLNAVNNLIGQRFNLTNQFLDSSKADLEVAKKNYGQSINYQRQVAQVKILEDNLILSRSDILKGDALRQRVEQKRQAVEQKLAAARLREENQLQQLAAQVVALLEKAIINNVGFWASKVSGWGSYSYIGDRQVPGGIAECRDILLQEISSMEKLNQLKQKSDGRKELLLTRWKYKFGIRKKETMDFYNMLSGIDPENLTQEKVTALEAKLNNLKLDLSDKAKPNPVQQFNVAEGMELR